jgi:hypothetical protein
MAPETVPLIQLQGDLGEGVGIIDPLRNHRWDRFVERHPYGWLTHLSGWKRVLDETFPHLHGYYLTIQDQAGGIEGALPLYSVDSWLMGKRLVSIPFATLCDPLVADAKEMERLFRAAVTLSRRIGIPRIEIKTVCASHLLDKDSFITDSGYKRHFLNSGDDPDRIRKTFHRTCVRQRIARAEQSGLRLVRGASESHLKQFYLLHRQTRKRNGLPPHPYRLIKSLANAFAGSCKVELLLCYKEDEAVAGVMVFKYKDRVSVEYSAVNASYNALSPVHLLFWNTIKDACLAGYRILDFGQTSIHNKSLMEFKSHWGTEVSDLPHFIYPNDPALSLAAHQDTLGKKLLQYVCNKAPDPALTYLGDFCYRHLG